MGEFQQCNKDLHVTYPYSHITNTDPLHKLVLGFDLRVICTCNNLAESAITIRTLSFSFSVANHQKNIQGMALPPSINREKQMTLFYNNSLIGFLACNIKVNAKHVEKKIPSRF